MDLAIQALYTNCTSFFRVVFKWCPQIKIRSLLNSYVPILSSYMQMCLLLANLIEIAFFLSLSNTCLRTCGSHLHKVMRKGCKLECNVVIPIYVCSIFEAQRPGRSFSVQQRLGAFLFKVEIFVK